MADNKEKQTPLYDAGYKTQFTDVKEFLHFLRKYVNAKWAEDVRPEDITLCDKEFILEDYQKRTADLVYKIEWKGKIIYTYLIMELQSTVDYTMPFRLLAYIFSLMLKIFLAEDQNVRESKDYRLPVVVPILFYNGDFSWNVPLKFRYYQENTEEFGDHVLDFTYYLVDLKKIPDDYILNTNTLIDNILALDKNRKNKKGLGRLLEEIEDRIGELKETDRVSFFQWLEFVMMAVVDEEGKRQVRILMDELKGDADSMIHGLQLLILNEREEGVAEGITMGIKRGELRKLISQVCHKLNKGRTSSEIAEDLEEEPEVIARICEIAREFAPEYQVDEIVERIMEEKK